ncbi:MAG: thiosulfate oxidation carrier protein SoxY [Burkholderiales bacterium]
MTLSRRNIIRTLAIAGAAAVLPLRLLAAQWNKAAFDAKAVADAMKYIGATDVKESDRIQLKTPEIAENGAIVPIEITSQIAGTQTIYILAEKNPQPLAASFDFSDGTEPFLSTRIKMGESSKVRIVVKADGKFYTIARDVKVTIGGCGG